MKEDYKAIFFPNKYYHVFNHAVGKDKLFLNPGNYHHFLRLFDKHISPVADVFCYCLLPNHFHFLIATKNEGILTARMELLQYKRREEEIKNPAFGLQQFSNLFNAYTKAFNKQQGRIGKLFIEPFNRRFVETSAYYLKLVHYIHANPVHHGFCKTVDAWPYTSYQQILNKNKWLQHEEIIHWFGSVAEYVRCHEQPISRKF